MVEVESIADMRLKLKFLFLGMLIFCACNTSNQIAQVPTVAQLPSLTPTITSTPTETLTSTVTPSPTATWTANSETLIAQGNATNEAQQATLVALWTWMASSPTYTPTASQTLTPSQTITNTVTPTQTPRVVVEMQPVLMYARSIVNLRACAWTRCEQVGQLRERDIVMATGTTQGEAVNGGSALWYRVEYNRQQAFVYNSLVSDSLPTPVPPTLTPLPVPIYVPPTTAPYVAPAYQAPEPSNNSNTSGATAVCRDGWISYSAHRRGTCSHHGGVDYWINRPPS